MNSLKQFTDITVLLDRSGSMTACKEAMETAYNTFIEKHKTNPSTRVTLIQFDSKNDYDVVYQSVPVTAVERLNLQPRGDTPLLDAMCQTIDNLGKRYANLPENERPDQVLVVIITDGQENASRIYKRSDVSKRVTKQTDHYNWNFVYLGANQDAISEARSLGMAAANAISYDIHKLGETVSFLADNTVAYTNTQGGMRGTKAGASSTLDWKADQRKKAKED